jgi:hypothetical protein
MAFMFGVGVWPDAAEAAITGVVFFNQSKADDPEGARGLTPAVWRQAL